MGTQKSHPSAYRLRPGFWEDYKRCNECKRIYEFSMQALLKSFLVYSFNIALLRRKNIYSLKCLKIKIKNRKISPEVYLLFK